MSIPGVDAGNSRFKCAVSDITGNPKLIPNRHGELFTPSAVYFASDGTIVIGSEALNAGFMEPARLVVNWKRHMGTNTPLYVADDGTSHTAMDILALLLQDAKENIEAHTGEVVNEAVITVPANYTDAQKQQTKDAAAKVGIEAILLFHEPSAAAIGNKLHKRRDSTALVYDLGGGTFDVSIVRTAGGVCDILATGGEPAIGGRDFNDRVAEKILDEFEREHGFRPGKADEPVFHQEMAQRIEQAKISLSAQTQTQIVVFCRGKQLQMKVTREQFNSWVDDLAEKTMTRTRQTVEDAGLSLEDIDEVYAVGGGAMMPIIQDRIEHMTGKKVAKRCEPHCAAALGAVVAGRIEYERQGKAYTSGGVTLPPPGVILHDILSHSIGIMVLSQKDNQEICSTILSKDTPIPSIQTKLFQLSEPNQTAAGIQILQGEDGHRAGDALVLGHFDLKDLPPRPDLIGRIEVTFALDSSGLLSAKARDNASGITAELQLDYPIHGDTETTAQTAA